MAILYRFDPDANIVRTEATGVLTTGDIIGYLATIIEERNIGKGFIEIVDFSSVEDLVVRYSELDPFVDFWEQYKIKGCKATIILAPTDFSFGTIRMLQTVVLLRFAMDEDHFTVVRSKEELEFKLQEIQGG